MAKKPSNPTFSTDDYGFGSEFDFPDFNFEPQPVKNKREAITRIGNGVREGIISGLKSPSFFQSMIRKALPESYGRAIDLVDQSAASLRELYNDGFNEVKPVFADVGRQVDKLMPQAEKYLNKTAVKKLKEFADKHRPQPQNSGLNAGMANDLAIAQTLNDIFKATASADISRETRSTIQDQLKEVVTQSRHRDQLTQLDGIRTGISEVVAADRKRFNYYRKSLELQMRSYFVSVEALQEQKRQNAFNTSHLQGILHNTSLPDYVLMKTSDQFKQQTTNKFINHVTGGLFEQRKDFVEKIKKSAKAQLMGSVRAGVRGLRSGLAGAEAGADDADNPNVDRWRLGGQMAGGIIANQIGNRLAPRLNQNINSRSSRAARMARTVGNKLRYGVDQLPQHANDFSNSRRSAGDYTDQALEHGPFDWMSDTWKSRITNVANKLGNPLVDFGRGTIKRAAGYDNEIKQGNLDSMNQPAVFTSRTDKSINDIIPGLLARVHQELRIIRTGDPTVDVIKYNLQKGTFDSSRGVKKSAFKSLINKKEQDHFQEQSKKLIDSIDPTGSLTPEQRKILANRMMQDNMLKGNAGSLKKYSSSNAFSGSDEERQNADVFTKLFKDMKRNDPEGKVQADFGASFANLGKSFKDPRAQIQTLIDTGHREELEEMGILSAGSNRINMQVVAEYQAGKKTFVPKGGKKPSSNGTPGTLGNGSNSGLPGPMPLPPAPVPLPPPPPALPPPGSPGGPIIPLGPQPLPPQGVDIVPVVTQLEDLRKLTERQNPLQILEAIRDTLTHIQQRVDQGFGSGDGGPGPGPGGPGGPPPGRRGLLRRIGSGLANVGDMTVGNIVRGGWNASKWGIRTGAKVGNALVGGSARLAFGGVKLLGRGVAGVGAGGLRRAMGHVDIYVGNEPKPRMLARMLQDGGVYFDQATNKPIRRLKDITGTVVSRINGEEKVVLEADEIDQAWCKQGPVKKALKGMIGVVKFGAKVSGKVIGGLLSVLPPIYRGALWAGKKAWGLLDMAQDIFVKGKLDDPAMTARLMRAGSYHSTISGNVISKPSQIDGPVVIGTGADAEIVLTHDDIRKGLVDKNGKPIKTGLRKLLGLAFGGVGRLLSLTKKVTDVAWKGMKGAASGAYKATKAVAKAGVNIAGFGLDVLRGRPMFQGGNSPEALKLGQETKSVLERILALLEERMVKPKHVAGDVDGDGVREGSYEDQMKRKKEAEQAGRPDDNNTPGADPGKRGGILGGAKKLWNKLRGKKDDDEDGDDNDLGGGGDRSNRRNRPRRGPSWRNSRGFKGKAKFLAKAAGRGIMGVGRFGASMLGIGGLGLGGMAMGAMSGLATAGSAVAGGAMAAGGAILGGLGTAAAAIGSVLTAPVLLGVGAVALIGVGAYYGYKYLTKKKLGSMSRIRYVQYGFSPKDEEHLNAVFGLEDKLKDSVQYSKEGATLVDGKVDKEKLMDDFGVDKADKGAIERWALWFASRFKPVFLTHLTALKGVAPDKWLDDVDKLKPAEMRKYFNAIKFPEGPYGVSMSPFKDLKSLPSGAGEVKALLKAAEEDMLMMEKLDKAKPTVAVAGAAAVTAAGIAATKAGETTSATGVGVKAGTGLVTTAALNEALKQNTSPTGLTAPRAMTTVVGSSTILESLGSNRLDAIAAIRMKAYGLKTMEADKVRVLMSLEKMVEPGITYIKKVAQWSGSLEQILSQGAPLFGIDTSDTAMCKVWLSWFNQRFLPVFLNYATALKVQTDKENIQLSKDMLKPNQLAEVATAISVSSVKSFAGGSVWTITDSPWAGYELNTDVKSVDMNIQGIKEMTKNTVLGQEGEKGGAGQGGNFPSQRPGIDVPKLGFLASTKAMISNAGTAVADAGSKVASGLTSVATGAAFKDMYNTAKSVVSGNGIPVSGDARVVHSGKGSGGDINSLPLPKGNKSWKALQELITAASSMVGVDPKLMAVMAALESGFDVNAKAGTSSASGLYQFIDSTWDHMLRAHGSKYGIDPRARQTDPRANALLGAEYIKENSTALNKVLKRPLTDTDLYFAHFLGSGGASKFLTADPNAVAANLFPKAASANKSIFYTKEGSPLTIAQVYALVNQRVRTRGSKFGINDGGEALTTSAPATKPADGTPPAGGAEGTAAIPKATQNPIGAKPAVAAMSTVAASAPVKAPVNTPDPTSSPGVAPAPSKINMNAAFAGPNPFSASDLNEQNKFQQEVKIAGMSVVQTTLGKSLEVQTQILGAINILSQIMQGKSTPPDATPATPPPIASPRTAPRTPQAIARSPVSVAKPVESY